MPDTTRTASYFCLRCGHQYEESYDPREVRERACPRCGSNSVRRVRQRAAAKKTK